MMDIRKKILSIFAVCIIIVLLVVLYFLIIYKTKTEVNVENEIINTEQELGKTMSSSILKSNQVLLPQIISSIDVEPGETYLKQLARIFVERFSSYSNQNENQHIEDVLSLATVSMQRWLVTQRIDRSNNYEGVTARVIASFVEDFNEESAVVVIEVQQVLKDNVSEKTEQRSGRVNLEKVNDEWKVSGFFWD